MNKEQLTQEMIDRHFASVVLNGSAADVAFYAHFVHNPNVPDSFGRLPIWNAVQDKRDNHQKTRIVIKLHPHLDPRNDEGQTPLMVMMAQKHIGVALQLVHAGADMMAVDDKDNGILKYAALSRSAEMVRAVMQAGALYRLDKLGHGEAYYAVQNNDPDVFKELFRSMDQTDQNPAYVEIKEAIKEGFLEKGTSAWQESAAHQSMAITNTFEELNERAAKYMSEEEQRRLSDLLGYNVFVDKQKGAIEYFNNPTQNDEKKLQKKLTALLFNQVTNGTADDVLLLLKAGANSNAYDKMGRTVLYCAVDDTGRVEDSWDDVRISANAFEKTKFLLQAGADPNLPNLRPQTGLKMDKWAVDNRAVCQAVIRGRVGIMALLIKKGADLGPDSMGNSLVKLAILYSPVSALDVLQKAGVPLTGAVDKDGHTALYWAVKSEKPHMVQALAEFFIKSGQVTELNPQTPEGALIWEMASKSKEAQQMRRALKGQLDKPVRKATAKTQPDTFEEKIRGLTDASLKRLCSLAGISIAAPTLTQTLAHMQAKGRHTAGRDVKAAWLKYKRAMAKWPRRAADRGK